MKILLVTFLRTSQIQHIVQTTARTTLMKTQQQATVNYAQVDAGHALVLQPA